MLFSHTNVYSTIKNNNNVFDLCGTFLSLFRSSVNNLNSNYFFLKLHGHGGNHLLEFSF